MSFGVVHRNCLDFGCRVYDASVTIDWAIIIYLEQCVDILAPVGYWSPAMFHVLTKGKYRVVSEI